MDGILVWIMAIDKSTRRNRVRRWLVLLRLVDINDAWPELVDYHRAGIRWRAWPRRCLTAYAECIVRRTLARGKEQIWLRKESCWIELQSLVVAGREWSDLIVIWRLLSASLIADGDNMNRIVVLEEINFQFLFLHLRFSQFIESLKAFSFAPFLPRSIIVGTLKLCNETIMGDLVVITSSLASPVRFGAFNQQHIAVIIRSAPPADKQSSLNTCNVWRGRMCLAHLRCTRLRDSGLALHSEWALRYRASLSKRRGTAKSCHTDTASVSLSRLKSLL